MCGPCIAAIVGIAIAVVPLRRWQGYIIGVGRFRILGVGWGGKVEKYWGGGSRGGQIPSRHMTS